MKYSIVRARVNPGKDDDLIEWLVAQSDGQRSEAIRALMRDGLRMRELEKQLPILVHQSIQAAMRELNVEVGSQSVDLRVGVLEDEFGDRLDRMLGGFG